MIRMFAVAASLVAVSGVAAAVTADPTSRTPRPTRSANATTRASLSVQAITFAYNCDTTGVMQDMTWTASGAPRRRRYRHRQLGRVQAQLRPGPNAGQSDRRARVEPGDIAEYGMPRGQVLLRD